MAKLTATTRKSDQEAEETLAGLIDFFPGLEIMGGKANLVMASAGSFCYFSI